MPVGDFCEVHCEPETEPEDRKGLAQSHEIPEASCPFHTATKKGFSRLY